MKNGGGHFELESGGHFKLELGGQYHWNLQLDARCKMLDARSWYCNRDSSGNPFFAQ